MSVWAMSFQRRHTENPCFSVIPSGGVPDQIRFSQRTSVTLLN
jgi:hypothetical protein